MSSATTTIMFTDLVGSTALGDRLGDEAAQALRRAHDRIARQQFQRFAGRVIKGTGDGFLVAFGSARQGVECAIALQRAITTQHNEGRYAELQVRIGLHTGEPLADEDDLLGSDVNLAARIEAEAAGGQVFVSESTHVLARKTPDTSLQDILPSAHLRGVLAGRACAICPHPAGRPQERAGPFAPATGSSRPWRG